jgi:hypothetical protein
LPALVKSCAEGTGAKELHSCAEGTVPTKQST